MKTIKVTGVFLGGGKYMKGSIKTKKQEIVDYWFSKVDESGLSVDDVFGKYLSMHCGT